MAKVQTKLHIPAALGKRFLRKNMMFPDATVPNWGWLSQTLFTRPQPPTGTSNIHLMMLRRNHQSSLPLDHQIRSQTCEPLKSSPSAHTKAQVRLSSAPTFRWVSPHSHPFGLSLAIAPWRDDRTREPKRPRVRSMKPCHGQVGELVFWHRAASPVKELQLHRTCDGLEGFASAPRQQCPAWEGRRTPKSSIWE